MTRCLAVLVTILTISLSAKTVGADNLFKGKEVVKIGKGEQHGKMISWSTCSGKYDRDYDVPPYSLDKADNCNVGAPSFGLECVGERCRVVDQEKLRKYVPDARNGDEVTLRIDDSKVTITHKGKAKVMAR